MSKSLGNVDRPPRRDGAPRRRRAPLGPADERLAVVVPAARRVGAGGGRPAVPADALERLLVLRPVRERRGFRPAAPAPDVASRPILDRWILSRLAGTVREVRDRMDDYDATGAGRTIQAFVDDLSNWYVRRSRRRFWDPVGAGVDTTAAFSTLHECLVTTATLLGPFTPFIAEELWSNLAAGRAAGPTPSTSRTTRPCTRRRWTPGWTTRWPWLGRSSSSAVGCGPRRRRGRVSRSRPRSCTCRSAARRSTRSATSSPRS